MQIWKFGLNITDRQIICMPKGSQILTVQTQDESLQLWAMCDPLIGQTENREILVIGTGRLVSTDVGPYIGTAQMPGLGLVWHVFEAPRREPTIVVVNHDESASASTQQQSDGSLEVLIRRIAREENAKDHRDPMAGVDPLR